MRFAIAAICLLSASARASEVDEWFASGITAYREARFTDAFTDFDRVLQREPGRIQARLFKATLYLFQYKGINAYTPENFALREKAIAEFQRVLETEPHNLTALFSLAELIQPKLQSPLYQDQHLKVATDLIRYYSEAAKLYESIPDSDATRLHLYRAVAIAARPPRLPYRQRCGMTLNEPGPIRDPAIRREFQETWGAITDTGFEYVRKALAINPKDPGSQSTMRELLLGRADMREGAESQADQMEARRFLPVPVPHIIATPGLPTAPRAPSRQPGVESRLLYKEDPVAPSGAIGTVRLDVTLGRKGSPVKVESVSGPEPLRDPAREAVKKWLWQPAMIGAMTTDDFATVEVRFPAR